MVDSQTAEPSDSADAHLVEFDVAAYAAGPITIRCSAADTAEQPASSSVEVSAYIDRGPSISLIQPDGPRTLFEPVVFEYEVAPAPLFEEDEQAAVDPATVLLEVRGQQFPMTQKPDEPGVYTVSVDFDDEELWADPPTGELLVQVTADNERGNQGQFEHSFILDGKNPTVRIVSPADNAVVGGIVDIRLALEDDLAGIDLDTLVLTMNEEPFPYSPTNGRWIGSGRNITFRFETGTIGTSLVQLNVNVVVQDLAGNTSADVSVLYHKDEVGPLISLDTPLFQESDSLPFDPLGSAVNPGDLPDSEFVLFRAAIVDRTNEAGQTVRYFAGVDETTAELWVARGTEELVVDTDDDGKCDQITTSGAKVQLLTRLAPEGAVEYPDDLNSPPPLCDGESDLTRVIREDEQEGVPAIYAINPDNDAACTGQAWEVPTANLEGYQGWVCAAARVEDLVGNRSVSAPVAFCLDNSQVAGAPACATALESPPACTDGCTPSAAFPSEGVVISPP